MDLLASLQVLVRRWYVLLVGLLLVGSLGFVLSSRMAPSYETVASDVLLAPANDPLSKQAVNPLMQFAGYLETTASLLTGVVNGEQSRADLVQGGASGDFTLEVVGPIVTVTAKAPTSEGAQKTAAMVLARVKSELDRRQKSYGTTAKDQIRVDTVVAPDTSTYQFGSRLRVLGAMGVLGLAGTITATFAFDGVMRRRQRPAGEVIRAALAPRTVYPPPAQEWEPPAVEHETAAPEVYPAGNVRPLRSTGTASGPSYPRRADVRQSQQRRPAAQPPNPGTPAESEQAVETLGSSSAAPSFEEILRRDRGQR